MFDLEHEHKYLFLPHHNFLPEHEFSIGPRFLVSIPDNVAASFYFPDFSLMGTLPFWEAVVSICLVGSLESMLSSLAVDRLDTWRRKSDLDRDLTAVGIGNTIAGMLGGLPMIAEIVRSSANVNNGARTAWANFFHGLFLLTFVTLFPRVIHEIPLASLAALLVYTGFRLASPQAFARTLEIGIEQLALFVITILAVLYTDLLAGVLIGILTKALIHLWRGVRPGHLFSLPHAVTHPEPDTYYVKLDGSAIFTNYIALKNRLATIAAPGKKVIIDLSHTYLIDHTVIDYLTHFAEDYARRGGLCELHGLEAHEPTSHHPLAMRVCRQNAA